MKFKIRIIIYLLARRFIVLAEKSLWLYNKFDSPSERTVNLVEHFNENKIVLEYHINLKSMQRYSKKRNLENVCCLLCLALKSEVV